MSFVKKWGDNSTDDYNSCLEDVYMYKDNPDITHDDDNIWLGTFASTNRITRSLIRFAIKDDLTLLGATSIISAKLYLYTNTLNGTHNVSAFRVVQDWNEAELTWNSFKSGGSWNSPGVESTSDSAVDDDVTYDRFATAEDIKSSGSVGGYNCILDLTSLAQKWFSGDNKEYGIFLLSDNEAINNNVQFIDHEGADGNRPYLEIEYEIVFDPNDWANKLKLVIDSSKIDENIINFPVLITLSSGSGQTGFDATDVFDELATVSGSYDNRKKIAVTTTISGVETELYVEIETWDDTTSSGNKQAWLWTKVPTISLCTDTDLYLYYDSAHTTNSGYVGDTGETPAQNVWDDNFVGVWHMAQDPSGGSDCILDSTGNGNNGTPTGMNASDLISGQPGKALDFDGAQYINCGDDTSIKITGNITIEVVAKITTSQNNTMFISKWSSGSSYLLAIFPTDHPTFIINDGSNKTAVTIDTYNDSTYHYYAGFFNGSNVGLWVDGGTENITGDSTSGPITNTANNLIIGAYSNAAGKIHAEQSELRISNIARPESWRKATYYSNWDDLISYTGLGFIVFTFTNSIPTHLSTVYGINHTLQLTTTISGGAPSYNYDAVFYDASDDSQIGSTASGTSSGQAASTTMQTPSGIDYSWYLVATSSGDSDTSSTYTFTNKFLCSGTTEVDSVLTADIPIRLYRRSTGVLIGSTTSISGGLFEIESTYNESHYAIALHPTDSGTNALIYDYLTP